MSANLTVIGLFNYDNTLLDGIDVAGIDKNILINTILLRCGEFEVLYSDLQFFKSAIKLWNDKHRKTFEKWINAVNITYNPIHNYDKIEQWEDFENVSNTSFYNNSSENKVSAYDSPNYQNDKKIDNNGDGNENTTKNVTRKGSVVGNIGVTTTQEMLLSEFEVAKWNVYEHIADLFVTEFCLLVY